MSYTYSDKKRTEKPAGKTEAAPAQPSLDALRSGAAAPTTEQMGHRVDLPDAMREKMESAFGADLSAVKLYESEAVGEAGANAITQGSSIAFAPGMLDFTSFGGQALLGHEISHVVSQARGEVTGGGFLNDRALEARADREGTMAAAGETVSLPAASMSSVSAAAAAGPMQASKAEDKVNKAQQEQMDLIPGMVDLRLGNPGGYQDSKAYQLAQKKLHKAQAQEKKWRGKLGPDQHMRSTGMLVADRMKERSRGDHYESGDYFDDMDAAMEIMGLTGGNEDPELMDRLRGEANDSYGFAQGVSDDAGQQLVDLSQTLATSDSPMARGLVGHYQEVRARSQRRAALASGFLRRHPGG